MCIYDGNNLNNKKAKISIEAYGNKYCVEIDEDETIGEYLRVFCGLLLALSFSDDLISKVLDSLRKAEILD